MLLSVAMWGKTIYLIPNDWRTDNATFFLHSWGESENDAKFAMLEDNLYFVTIPDDNSSFIFIRMSPGSASIDWDHLWNKTGSLVNTTDNCLTITGWGAWDVSWSKYDPNKFYVTGDSALVVDAGAGAEKKWTTDAIPSPKDTLTLSGLKAGQDYKLKITVDGTWDTAKGYNDLTVKPDGLHDVDGNDHNIGFKLNSASDVKVVYTSSVFKLIGDFYVETPIVPTMKMVKLVPSEEWLDANAKFAAWIWGNKIEAHWTAFFTPVSEGNDTLQAEIISTADSIDFVRFSPKATVPTWDKQGDYVVVWNEAKDTIDWTGLTATIEGWDKLSWKPVEKPCSGYGLLVDGENYIDAKHDVLKDEYYLRSVHLTKGQTLKIKNKCNSDAWVITKFAETSYILEIKDGSYVIADDGDYDFYIKLINANDEIYISKAGTYTTAVRSQCTDVMIQAFYNESYNESAGGVSECGKTRWWNFLNDKAEDGVTTLAEEMGHYFDLVWLPPSAEGSGMGYHPKRYSSQNSTWGTAEELATLISTLHNAGSKVVADVVINHCEGWTSWCDFPEMDFGEYGKFYPDHSYICQNDEVNGEWNKASAGSCYGKASGSNDDGENWDGARDWSHNDVYVQEMFKAYLKWLRFVVGYDGFRYDKGDGFNNWHHDNYNKTAGPYIAFMECYSNTDEIWGRIQGANYNLMGLDFDTKWHVFDAFAGWDYDGKYGKPRGDGLLGRNNGRYAVTFIDSHDWFRRGNGCEFGGDGNSLKAELLPRLLVANAFMLSMPGVPCVFYPHWAKYKGFLKNMIDARKLAGVHSESEVKDEQFDENGYQATIVGKDGYLILCLGNKAHASGFDGYTLMSSYYATNDCNSGRDGSHQIWVQRTTPLPTGMENTDSEPVVKAEKFMKDGRLYIRLGGRVFDATGRLSE